MLKACQRVFLCVVTPIPRVYQERNDSLTRDPCIVPERLPDWASTRPARNSVLAHGQQQPEQFVFCIKFCGAVTYHFHDLDCQNYWSSASTSTEVARLRN